MGYLPLLLLSQLNCTAGSPHSLPFSLFTCNTSIVNLHIPLEIRGISIARHVILWYNAWVMSLLTITDEVLSKHELMDPTDSGQRSLSIAAPIPAKRLRIRCYTAKRSGWLLKKSGIYNTAQNSVTERRNAYAISASYWWIRKCSIDKIPQLICILVGKMSIIYLRPTPWN